MCVTAPPVPRRPSIHESLFPPSGSVGGRRADPPESLLRKEEEEEEFDEVNLVNNVFSSSFGQNHESERESERWSRAAVEAKLFLGPSARALTLGWRFSISGSGEGRNYF